MATVLDALQTVSVAPSTEHEPIARLANLVALLRRRTESATDGSVGRVPPQPEIGAAQTTDTYRKN